VTGGRQTERPVGWRPCGASDLTHPELDFWVDVRMREFDGRWLAVADLAGESDVGTGTKPREALRETLTALGPRLAEELAAGAELDERAAGWEVIGLRDVMALVSLSTRRRHPPDSEEEGARHG
jgi:hypothetical protein